MRHDHVTRNAVAALAARGWPSLISAGAERRGEISELENESSGAEVFYGFVCFFNEVLGVRELRPSRQ